MVKHRSAKRATKRSAKRAAKRGAYKSKRTHRKMKLSRKRMQRGGGLAELRAAAAAFKADRLDPAAAAIIEKADAVAAAFLANFSNIPVDVLVGLIKTVKSLKTMFQILSTIAEISIIVGEEKKMEMKTKLTKLITNLRESMKEYMDKHQELKACVETLQSKGETGGVVVNTAPPTDVGKTCVFKEGSNAYQALVVGDRTTEQGDHVLDLWLNGAGYDPKQVQYYLVEKGFITFVDETSTESSATDKYGQSPVTLKEARKFYEIPAPGAAADVEMIQSSTEEPSLISKAKDLVGTFMKSDKKQALLDIISGFKAVALSKLDRVSSRFQDQQLKDCVNQIKNALTAKIGEQLNRVTPSPLPDALEVGALGPPPPQRDDY